MKLESRSVLLTGAAGGIGRHLALALASRGARLTLVDRNAEAVDRLVAELASAGARSQAVVADLAGADGRALAVREAVRAYGTVDVLVNLAAIQYFGRYDAEEPGEVEALLRVNLVVPMLLAREVLPAMIERSHGQIVNVGSVFGTLGFAWFTAYSASKFGLRGFSEALRRELDGSGVGVTYIAPRAVRTALNSDAVQRMAEHTRMHLDDPAPVASRMARAIERGEKECYIGRPEAWFARLNALAPRLLDLALRGRNRSSRGFAEQT